MSLKRRRAWLDKWLSLQLVHPKIQLLESFVYDFASQYAKNPSRGKTIVVFGENGCGKTKTARSIAKWANSVAVRLPEVMDDIGARLAKCEYAHWPSVVNMFHRKQFDRTEELIASDMLILDDIGAEHDPSGFAKEQLYLILCRREFKWNFVTTNIPPAEWPTKFERRIASRLFRNASHIDMSDVPDFCAT